MSLARLTSASFASPTAAMPERSPLISEANTETPAREKPSARTCNVTVLPVPVAPVTRPCRLASARLRAWGLSPLMPTKIVPSLSISVMIHPCDAVVHLSPSGRHRQRRCHVLLQQLAHSID